MFDNVEAIHSHFFEYRKPSIMNHLSQAIFVLGFIVIIGANLSIHYLYFATSIAASAICIYNQRMDDLLWLVCRRFYARYRWRIYFGSNEENSRLMESL